MDHVCHFCQATVAGSQMTLIDYICMRLKISHTIAVTSYVLSSVTHVRRNILKRQGEEKLN